jgi:hypothetical protein
VLEPWLTRAWDASAQLVVREDGGVELLGTLAQELTPAGAPRGHRGVLDGNGEVASGLARDAELRAAALHVARAAAEAGYRGPCGVDSFAYRDPESGAETLRPVVELNARFTVGTVAIGYARRALEAARSRGELAGGAAVDFVFALDGEIAPQGPGALRVSLGAGSAALGLAVRRGAQG